MGPLLLYPQPRNPGSQSLPSPPLLSDLCGLRSEVSLSFSFPPLPADVHSSFHLPI